ncbi:Lar family restriction alleviation protein [Providencia hangzhouensis]|jgi:Lar family restriction alleviation protein|uniref:Putative transcription elongation factor Elf1 n=1 Tax=Providencia rettgeri TaxID=587 RepID=A0A2X2DMP0_PRORE|nr:MULTISPECIES: Lar family restriction alleviation protein [Providencia]AXH61162.1 restriction alleviation protein, Lar family [Providencia huaxiensis]EIL1981264.1 Lar family restriction alleviation protein [Providencia rettgeri]EIU9514035.1 Lar family restriction alleviation protein [Providencia rettgeri]ELR5094088.1 Lar family restriction alleviation protein [Providencia rettgeri]ELR5297670.1 Lar family restriction alleviation protein [Providencia rettgeri]
MKSKIAEIYPCPHCGSENITIESHSYRTWFYIQCHSCGEKGPEVNDKPTAVIVWNERVVSI